MRRPTLLHRWLLCGLACSIVSCADATSSCRDAACLVPPDGWSGPDALFLVSSNDGPALCPAPFVELGMSYQTGPSAADATCACDCERTPSADTTCTQSATVQVYDTRDDGCTSSNLLTAEQIDGECGDISMVRDRPVAVTPIQRPIPGGACAPVASTELSPVTWEQSASLCAIPSPAPDDALVCIWTEGEVDCPIEFDIRHVLYDAVDDTRQCTDCTCGDPMVSCDVSVVSLYAGTLCRGSSTDGAAEECMDAGSLTRSVGIVWGSPVVTCQPSQVEPTGRASGIGAVTTCCIEA